MPYGDYTTADWLDEFFNYVLGYLGLSPTSWRLQFLETHAHFETAGGQAGTGKFFNPLGTTWKTPGAQPNIGGQENVWLFPSVAEGAYATARTIANYVTYMEALISERVVPGVAQAIGGTWGTGGFADLLSGGWEPETPSYNIPTMMLPAPPEPPSAAIAPAPLPPAPSAPYTPQAPYVPPSPIPSPTPIYYPAATPFANIINIQPGAGIPQNMLKAGQNNIVQLSESIPVSDLVGWRAFQYVKGAFQPLAPGASIAPGIVQLVPA